MSDKKLRVAAGAITEKCINQKGQSKPDCYKAELRALTKEYGLVTGEKALSFIQEKDSHANTCHVISHYIAREAYLREQPDNFYKLLDSINVNACGSGYLHGTLEAYTAEHPEIEMDGVFAETMCDRGDDFYRKTTCIHMMGHLLLLNTYGDVTEALKLCELLPNKWRFNCYDGMFMEDHQKLALFEHGMSELPENTKEYMQKLEARCRTYADPVVARACWLEMAEPYAHTYGYNAEILYKECMKAPKPEFQEICYRKAGTALSTYYNYDSKEELTSICTYYEKNAKAYDSCIANITTSLMYTSPKFILRGVTLCANVKTEHQQTCYMSLISKLKDAVKEDKLRSPYCEDLPYKYTDLCLAKRS